MVSIQNSVRAVLGISKDSLTWQNLLRDFRAWHRDPAYPERKTLTRRSEGFDTELASLIPYIAGRYLTATNPELDRATVKWPNDAAVIAEQLYQLAAYEGSENRRQARSTPARLINHSASPATPPQGTQSAAAGNPSALTQPARSSTYFDIVMGQPVPAEGSMSSDASVDLAFTEGSEALDNVGSYDENTTLDPNTQPSQASLTSRETTNTTVLVGVSTKSYVKPIPFSRVGSADSFRDVVLNAWGRDAYVTRMIELGKIELVTIKYPWSSSRCIEYYLEDAEAYTHMVQQIKGCPCWQTEHGTCMVEVELVVNEEED